MLFQTALGQAGLLLAVLVSTILGVPSAGGAYPVQMLPPFWQWLHAWLPLRFATDGARSLLFYQGNANAGLHTAVFVLIGYVVGSVALSALVVSLRGRSSQGTLDSAGAGQPGRAQEAAIVA